jgi:hypothetical protein
MYRAWTGRYVIKGVDSDADCVIGFSYGYRSKSHRVTPGLSNEDLADIALKHYANLPKILQFEIADAYSALGAEDAERVSRITRPDNIGDVDLDRSGQGVMQHADLALDTKQVALQAKAVMGKKGWKTALLLAHPYHMPRVQAVCDHYGISWVADSDERGAVEFDPRSSQRWTRDLGHWRGYEPLALCYYRLKGWL